MTPAKSVSIPLTSHFKLSADMPPKIEEEIVQMSSVSYLSVANIIIYNMLCSHSDVLYVVSIMSRFIACPCKEY